MGRKAEPQSFTWPEGSLEVNENHWQGAVHWQQRERAKLKLGAVGLLATSWQEESLLSQLTPCPKSNP